MDNPNNRSNFDDFTLPSKATLPRRPRSTAEAAAPMGMTSGMAAAPTNAPLMLQHFFEGSIDLDKELTARFANLPLLSVIRVRQFNGKVRSGSAILSSQDGSASALVEVDTASRDANFTFTLNGMLALTFQLSRLSDMDRAHWLDPMRRENGEIAFLWNQERWESDYLICTSHKHFTNLFAFSTHHVAAAARLTTDTSRKFLDWIAGYW
ncbi:MAG: hypothetical protein U0670_10080 [Anaerolineae bacterium]